LTDRPDQWDRCIEWLEESIEEEFEFAAEE
jgi:hypothetical protein